MGLSSFIRAHAVPSMLIAGGVLGTAYGIVSTGYELYTAGLPPWAVQLIGFVVLATGVISMLYQFHLQHEREIASLRAAPVPEVPAKTEAPTRARAKGGDRPQPPPKPLHAPDRDLMPDSFTQRFLKLMASAHTGAQVNALLRPHKGRWMRLSGYLVQVAHHGDYLFVQITQSAKSLTGLYAARFPVKEEGLLAGLNHGDAISFDAQITDRSGSMGLSNAALL